MHSADQIADAILALINAKPRSPIKAEIAAIIRDAEVSPPTDAFARWDRSVRAWLDEVQRTDRAEERERARMQLLDEIDAEAERIWALPVRSWGDVALRAVVAAHWNGDSPVLSYPDNVIAAGPGRDLDHRSLAFVVRAIFDLCGIRLDPEGRIVGFDEWRRYASKETHLSQSTKPD